MLSESAFRRKYSCVQGNGQSFPFLNALSDKMLCCSAIWGWSLYLGFVMLIECWISWKSSQNITHNTKNSYLGNIFKNPSKHREIAKRCPEYISSVVELSSCSYQKIFFSFSFSYWVVKVGFFYHKLIIVRIRFL